MCKNKIIIFVWSLCWKKHLDDKKVIAVKNWRSALVETSYEDFKYKEIVVIPILLLNELKEIKRLLIKSLIEFLKTL